jgi:hypothetical protein
MDWSAETVIRTYYDINIKFLELLSFHNETKQNVSASRSNTYAPTLFARHADADGIKKRQFEAAMQRLFKTKQIAVEERGSPSKLRKCLVLADSTRNLTMLMAVSNPEPVDAAAIGPSNGFQPNKGGPSNGASNGPNTSFQRPADRFQRVCSNSPIPPRGSGAPL